MTELIGDNYNTLQLMMSFGIGMGFEDKTVREICDRKGVDTRTFLVVVNYIINGYLASSDLERLSVPTLMRYLKCSHEFFLGSQLPSIRQALVAALDKKDSMAQLIMRLYDEYNREIMTHMRYEEKNVFPYVEALLAGSMPAGFSLETYSKHHSQANLRLRELNNIIIKYLPGDDKRGNLLASALYSIYSNEEWIAQHARVEDDIFIPAVLRMEAQCKQQGGTPTAGTTDGSNTPQADLLSEREKEVVAGVARGLVNKEIADRLNISLNTVITHRRNIARKLGIHSPAGLTIYAIVNGIVDISSVKL